MIVIPLAFAVLFALALVTPVSDLVSLPPTYEFYGIGDAVPWPLLVLAVALPPALYVVALLAGRGRTPTQRVLLFIVALATSFALYFGIGALVAAIQPPLA